MLDLINTFAASLLEKEMYINLIKEYNELRVNKGYYDMNFYNMRIKYELDSLFNTYSYILIKHPDHLKNFIRVSQYRSYIVRHKEIDKLCKEIMIDSEDQFCKYYNQSEYNRISIVFNEQENINFIFNKYFKNILLSEIIVKYPRQLMAAYRQLWNNINHILLK